MALIANQRQSLELRELLVASWAPNLANLRKFTNGEMPSC